VSDPRLVHTLVRARSMSSARTDEMRRALAHRICFDLLQALRANFSTGARPSSRAPEPARALPVEGRPNT